LVDEEEDEEEGDDKTEDISGMEKLKSALKFFLESSSKRSSQNSQLAQAVGPAQTGSHSQQACVDPVQAHSHSGETVASIPRIVLDPETKVIGTSQMMNQSMEARVGAIPLINPNVGMEYKVVEEGPKTARPVLRSTQLSSRIFVPEALPQNSSQKWEAPPSESGTLSHAEPLKWSSKPYLKTQSIQPISSTETTQEEETRTPPYKRKGGSSTSQGSLWYVEEERKFVFQGQFPNTHLQEVVEYGHAA
uniref:MBD domain-containing protein n=1 Tax=Gongylonema pulchrum TaxID=637853 RepID=A0A183CXS5_9BILA